MPDSTPQMTMANEFDLIKKTVVQKTSWVIKEQHIIDDIIILVLSQKMSRVRLTIEIDSVFGPDVVTIEPDDRDILKFASRRDVGVRLENSGWQFDWNEDRPNDLDRLYLIVQNPFASFAVTRAIERYETVWNTYWRVKNLEADIKDLINSL